MAGDGEETRIATRPSVPELFARLIANAQAWVKAEIALLKCRGETLVGALRTAVILIAAAVALATVALFALAIGLIFALAPVVGPAWATAIVVVTLLVIAGICGWLGVARLKRAFEDQS